MSDLTRRELLKTSLALCASSVASRPALAISPALGADPVASATSPVAAAPAPGNRWASSWTAMEPRQQLLLDQGWRFRLGNADDAEKDLGFGALSRSGTFAKSAHVVHAGEVDYDDSDWRLLDLPHDWGVELPFVEARYLPDHGAKPLGRNFPDTSIGWYRRVFHLDPSDRGKNISLLFDGVFRNALILINNVPVGETRSGYPPYSFDITDFVNIEGPNVILVRVDATLSEGWFYEGAGIYRHVWLLKKSPVYLTEWSPLVRSSNVTASSATLTFECEAINNSDSEVICAFTVSVRSQPDGGALMEARSDEQRLGPGDTCPLRAEASLPHPSLWSPEQPHVYQADFSLAANGQPVDGETLAFGVRTLRFDPDQGFFLNGRNLKIKGTCNHQDHAGVGSALPDRLQYYRVEILKQMGSNACRTSHNPPTPEFLDACDRLGMMVMAETRIMSSAPQALAQLGKMVRRFRNHPSVILWSLGNEEPLQGTPKGENIIRSMKKFTRRLDPTRLVTLAMNGGWGKGASQVVDVQGFNYHLKDIDGFHRRFPHQPTIGTETSSAVSDRGIYHNDPVRGYVSAYDVNKPEWGEQAEEWWSFYDSRPYLSGGFVWTGFDYRGEPTPYQWPCINSHFGLIDTCGFPKDLFHYYRSWWGTEPVLHLFPHWNWAGREGQPVDVWVFSNLDSVELLVNGRSLGSKPVKKNSHLSWSVPYASGSIEARGTKNGKVVLTTQRQTIGHPAGIRLHPDRTRIGADGADVSVVKAEIVDAQGRLVPTAGNLVVFSLDGPGRILGVGNGDPGSHEPDKATRRSAFNGLCMAIVQSLPKSGTITVHASSSGLPPAAVAIEAA